MAWTQHNSHHFNPQVQQNPDSKRIPAVMAGTKRSLEAMLGGHDEHEQQPPISEVMTRPPSPILPQFTGKEPSTFHHDASIVLLGIRGAGKSTLAIIASSAMNRKVVDLETAFQRALGVSSSAYKLSHGPAQCHKQQTKILQRILERHSNNSIIVCSWMERRVQALLRDFSVSHPVIHVVREAHAIQRHLSISDSGKMQCLLDVSNAISRTCTNFEFFNVSETAARPNDSPQHAQHTPCDASAAPYLTLKNVERHFLKFLSLMFPAGTIAFVESAFPLARVPTEERRFTYAVSIPLPDVLEEGKEIEEIVVGADAVQIVLHDLNERRKGDCAASELGIKLATDISRAVGIVRRSTVLPVIVHIYLPPTPPEEDVRLYLDLVNHAFRSAPEMVTVDLRLEDPDISRILAAKKRSKVIGNCYLVSEPPSWQSPTWMALYRKASLLKCDLVRLLRPASTMEDNFAIAALRCAVSALEVPGPPLIAYNTGQLGQHSAAFNHTLTVVRPESLKNLHPKFPITPWLTASGATKALYSSFIFEWMKLYVLGAKVDYSLSPAMHNKALEVCGIPHHYRPISCNSLSEAKSVIQDHHFGGASISLPFKVEIITLTDALSPHARAIGAVNTLIPIRKLDASGRVPEGAAFFDGVNRAGPVKALYGENTDWIGIRACIRRGLSPANAVVSSTCGVVIGAGGMARATVYAMLQLGVKNIVVYNRTLANAEKLVAHFTQLLQGKNFRLMGGKVEGRFHIIKSLEEPWPEDFRLPTVIVSCLPTHQIGDVPSPDFKVPPSWLGSRTGGVVIELGYKFLNTPLLVQVRNESHRGWVTMNGLDLLPEQGFAQFELFTGRRAPRIAMRREVLRVSGDQNE